MHSFVHKLNPKGLICANSAVISGDDFLMLPVHFCPLLEMGKALHLNFYKGFITFFYTDFDTNRLLYLLISLTHLN